MMHIRSLASMVALLVLPSLTFAAFPDVPADHVDAPAIEYLQQHNVFKGKPQEDGSVHFDPSAALNRAELVTILVRLLDLDPSIGEGECFSDVPTSAWYHNDVCIAEKMGLVSGYGNGTFKPEQHVNKAEAMKIILSAIQLSMDVEMYKGYRYNTEQTWYTPYLAMASEWRLLDDVRSLKKPEVPMTRADTAHLLYRTIITAMHRTVTGDLPVFDDALAAQYADHPIEVDALTEADAFETIALDGQLFKSEKLGLSVLFPKTMPTFNCDDEKAAPIVDLKVVEKGDTVYFGPEWYEEQLSDGDNPDGSLRYGKCTRYEMDASSDAYYVRTIQTRVVKNDTEIEDFIEQHFGKDCRPFERRASIQSGVDDLHVVNVLLPGVTHPDGLEDYKCLTNYAYVLKYHKSSKRILYVNLGQDGFVYLPDENGKFGRALDQTIMKTLRMF